MDLDVIGRAGDDERATLEELSGAPVAIGRPGRGWLLALAGIAAIACLGFAGTLVRTESTGSAGANAAGASESASSAADALGSVAPPQPRIELLQPSANAVTSDGTVPAEVRAAPMSHIHISVTIGVDVLGWRNVDLDDTGRWTGTLRVFAPQVALPAVVHAAGRVDGSAAEAQAAIILGGGPPLQLWAAWIDRTSDGAIVVRYQAAAPLTLSSIESWVTDRAGNRLGTSSDASSVSDWIPGSLGARDFGMGSIGASIPLTGRVSRAVTLHIAWRDDQSNATGAIERLLDASEADAP
jgi:hypothetical protein